MLTKYYQEGSILVKEGPADCITISEVINVSGLVAEMIQATGDIGSNSVDVGLMSWYCE